MPGFTSMPCTHVPSCLNMGTKKVSYLVTQHVCFIHQQLNALPSFQDLLNVLNHHILHFVDL